MIENFSPCYFASFDLIVAYVCSAAAAVSDAACATRLCCQLCSGATAGVLLLYLVAFLLLRPALVRADRVLLPAMALLTLLMAALSLVSNTVADEGVQESIGVVAEVLFAMSLAVLILAFLSNVAPPLAVWCANALAARLCPGSFLHENLRMVEDKQQKLAARRLQHAGTNAERSEAADEANAGRRLCGLLDRVAGHSCRPRGRGGRG